MTPGALRPASSILLYRFYVSSTMIIDRFFNEWGSRGLEIHNLTVYFVIYQWPCLYSLKRCALVHAFSTESAFQALQSASTRRFLTAHYAKGLPNKETPSANHSFFLLIFQLGGLRPPRPPFLAGPRIIYKNDHRGPPGRVFI